MLSSVRGVPSTALALETLCWLLIRLLGMRVTAAYGPLSAIVVSY